MIITDFENGFTFIQVKDLIFCGILFHNRGPVYMIDLRPWLDVINEIARLSLFLKKHPIFLVLFVGKLIPQDFGI